ncbi:unnamed protein product [Porites lobata]|uniref:Uncharacterized protein n=1 Tax=Porites lobata TaxID=104759 RepID=A0ABN8MUP8_9CNID|nr:unnamed protein product [Porites lobata]
MFMVSGENSTEELKRQHQALKNASVKSRMESIDFTPPSDLLRSVNQSRDKGASCWLTAVPLVHQGLVLNKQEFRDSLRMPLSDLPSKCVCTNVEVEPQLQPLDNERFNLRTAVTSPEARLDFKAGGFWSRGVTAFFAVRVTHVNSKYNQGKETSTIFKEQEEEKKRKYQQRVLDIEMGSFTPLVFGTNGGMGAHCNCFLKRLAEKLSEKNEEPYHITITWIRTLLSFEIIRGFRDHTEDHNDEYLQDLVHKLTTNAKHLKIAHLNNRGLRKKVDELRILLKLCHFDVFGVSETHLNSEIIDGEIGIKDYNLIRRDRPGRQGGGCVKYYRKSLKAIHRPDLEDEQVEGMCMQVKPDSRDILVGTIYRPPNQNSEFFTAFPN